MINSRSTFFKAPALRSLQGIVYSCACSLTRLNRITQNRSRISSSMSFYAESTVSYFVESVVLRRINLVLRRIDQVLRLELILVTSTYKVLLAEKYTYLQCTTRNLPLQYDTECVHIRNARVSPACDIPRYVRSQDRLTKK